MQSIDKRFILFDEIHEGDTYNKLMEESLPMNSDIIGSLIQHMDNYSVTFVDIYRWPRETSINCDNRLLLAQPFDGRVLNLKYMKNCSSVNTHPLIITFQKET